MSLTAMQAATIIGLQSTLTKISVTFGLRIWQMLANDKTKAAKLESREWVQRLCAAQKNEAEYAPLLVALLLFSASQDEANTWGTMAAISQLGYVVCRLVFGYPSLPVASSATMRYAALLGLCFEMYQKAF